MTKSKYLKKIKSYDKSFTKLYNKIVNDTIEFKKDNPDIKMNDSSMEEVERFADYLSLSGGWLYDEINDRFNTSRSMRKKIRKALGFIIP